jgi:hypothetical protein
VASQFSRPQPYRGYMGRTEGLGAGQVHSSYQRLRKTVGIAWDQERSSNAIVLGRALQKSRKSRELP